MTQAIAVSLLAVAGFIIALWWTNIAGIAHKIVGASMAGVAALFDNQLSDDAKEAAARRAGVQLILGGLNLTWRIALALAAAGLPILLADLAGLAPGSAVLDVMLRLDYIVIVSVLAFAAVKIVSRLRRSETPQDNGVSQYSPVDQFVHNLAFSGPTVQKAAARIEARLMPRPPMPEAANPIFVTSLARGGTTAVLNALHDAPEVATHTYRDMPFVTAPVLWNKLAGGQRREVRRQQRAHGDGMEIDLDSAEAFEEVIWKMFWPERYKGSSIPLWEAGDTNEQADRFLLNHMSSIIRARNLQADPLSVQKMRYCSKNNANIARIPYLLKSFPDCRIVVPVRRPESHAESLLRQHNNFSKLQTQDSFVSRYMADIGHFEFGNLHKPFMFSGFEPAQKDTHTPDYWLQYWTCAFRNLLAYKDKCIFLLQDDLRASPKATMEGLYDALGLSSGEQSFGRYFHSKPDLTETERFDPDHLQEAIEIYGVLEKCARRDLLRDVI
ncbi:sulfotransferase [Ruegeria arenilitoris]|uniref:sulfotransferase n=1 Tax=Ruegeria arenilitoris TaxID=1173585 RepID=UPI00147C8A56|nr:sulfotransferase [Ruegeria arenilitoris]